VIATCGLTKEYNGRTVVDGLQLQVHQGEIYGFLGPNGAGKSTTIGMILGLIPITRGEVRLFGKRLAQDYYRIKRRIGVVGEFQHLYREMTAVEYLSFFAELYGVVNAQPRINRLLERVDLSAAANLPLKAFSKGMQQKLSLTRALVHDPELLILDEPVSSLDPQGIKQVRDLILEEQRRGKTILISSHLLSEIEKTCQRLGIINQGRLVAEDTIAGLIGRLGGEKAVLEVELDEAVTAQLQHDLEQQPFISAVAVPQPNRLVVTVSGARDFRGSLSKFLTGQGLTVLSLRQDRMSLEEAFMTITENKISLLTGKEGTS
jgi:ABC-type multidrug transport system ATPase subunit